MDATRRLDETKRIETTKRINEPQKTIRLDNASDEVTQSLKSFKNYPVIENLNKKAGGEADIYLIRYGDKEAFVKYYRENIIIHMEVLEKIKNLSEKYDYFPKVYEIGKVGFRAYEIEEYLKNGTLEEKDVRDSLKEFIERISKALNVLHQNGIIHRDLKPENILFRGDKAVLSDFGISSLLDEEVSKRLTGMRATITYSAPESVAGIDGKTIIGKEVDWWSFGIILLEILDGHPLKGLSTNTVISVLSTKAIPIPKTLPDEYQVLLKGLLTRDPEKRWGFEEIEKWLKGEFSKVHYEEDYIASDLTFRFKKKFYSIDELAPLILKEENFDEALKLIDKGIWDGRLKDQRNPYLEELLDYDEYTSPEERLVFLAYTVLKEKGYTPFSLYGRVIDDKYMLRFLHSYITSSLDETDKKILRFLERGTFKNLVDIYEKIYDKNPLELKRFLPKYLTKAGAEQLLNMCKNYENKNFELLEVVLKYFGVDKRCAKKILSKKELFEIAKNNPLNQKEPSYIKALIANGYNEEAKKLIKPSKEYLAEAYKHENRELIDYLTDKGVDVNLHFYKGSKKYTPLLYLIEKKPDEVEDFIKKHSPDVNLRGYEAPLCAAIRKQDLKLIKLLFSEGARADIRCKKLPPLFMAVYSKDKKIFEEVLKRVKEVDIDYEGYTPLFLAVSMKNYDFAKKLIKKGADVNKKCGSLGVTPAMKAANIPDAKLIGMMLGKIDKKVKDNNNNTIANYIQNDRVKKLIFKEEIRRKNVLNFIQVMIIAAAFGLGYVYFYGKGENFEMKLKNTFNSIKHYVKAEYAKQ